MTGMTVLVTGSEGLVGRAVCGLLEARGERIVRFDRRLGDDVRDAPALEAAARGCDAIVHLAALLGEPGESANEIFAVNAGGTDNALAAARHAGARRFVFMSSADVLGVFKGERAPDYLPLDDVHPSRPGTPYGESKLRAEQACAAFSVRTAIPAISLRPPGVWSDETYAQILEQRRLRPSFEWQPFWEYGAFIDLRDLADAVNCALRAPASGDACFLVASSDLNSSGRTAREWARFVHPEVPWRGGEIYERDAYHSLVDCAPARARLGWQPRHRFAHFAERTGGV